MLHSVYLMGAPEVMEEDIQPYSIHRGHWEPCEAAALPDLQVKSIADNLVHAKEPLLIAGYSGRSHGSVSVLTDLQMQWQISEYWILVAAICAFQQKAQAGRVCDTDQTLALRLPI